MQRSGASSQAGGGGRKSAATAAAQQNKFRKLQAQLSPSSKEDSIAHSVGKHFYLASPSSPPRKSVKHGSKRGHTKSLPKAELKASPPKSHRGKEEKISTADLFNAIVMAPAPGPMWNDNLLSEDAESLPSDEVYNNNDDDDNDDGYPNYELEAKRAEESRREEERRKYLNEVKLASDLEDTRRREEEARYERRTSKGIITAYSFGNDSVVPTMPGKDEE